MLYTGVDWADAHHDAQALDEAGKKLGAIRVLHTAEGLAKLDAWLLPILGHQDKEQMACIVETSHGLLIAYLLEHGWPVSPVNPRTVDRKRSASGAKTDAIDAYLLAKTGRADFADLHRLTPDSEKVAELKGLTRDQDSLIRMQTRLVNQLTACLKDYYPVALDLFAKLQQRSTLLFLQTYPTQDLAQAASVEQIRQVLKAAGHTTASKVAPKIFEQLHQPSLRANAVTTRTKSRLALALIVQLLPLIEQLAEYDKDRQDLDFERMFVYY
jgi:transposase